MSREMVKIVQNWLEIQMVRGEAFGTSCSKRVIWGQTDRNKQRRPSLDLPFLPLWKTRMMISSLTLLILSWFHLNFFSSPLRERNDIPPCFLCVVYTIGITPIVVRKGVWMSRMTFVVSWCRERDWLTGRSSGFLTTSDLSRDRRMTSASAEGTGLSFPLLPSSSHLINTTRVSPSKQ